MNMSQIGTTYATDFGEMNRLKGTYGVSLDLSFGIETVTVAWPVIWPFCSPRLRVGRTPYALAVTLRKEPKPICISKTDSYLCLESVLWCLLRPGIGNARV